MEQRFPRCTCTHVFQLEIVKLPLCPCLLHQSKLKQCLCMCSRGRSSFGLRQEEQDFVWVGGWQRRWPPGQGIYMLILIVYVHLFLSGTKMYTFIKAQYLYWGVEWKQSCKPYICRTVKLLQYWTHKNSSCLLAIQSSIGSGQNRVPVSLCGSRLVSVRLSLLLLVISMWLNAYLVSDAQCLWHAKLKLIKFLTNIKTEATMTEIQKCGSSVMANCGAK